MSEQYEIIASEVITPEAWKRINPALVTIFMAPRIVAEFPNLPERQGVVDRYRTCAKQVDFKNSVGGGAATSGYSYYETGDALDFYSLPPSSSLD